MIFDMVKFTGLFLFSLFCFVAGSLQVFNTDRSFTINYEKNSFYMDGKPFRYVSGSAHYFRIPRQYWRDRLRKIKAASLNAVSTYVEWSLHESRKGQFDFNDNLDIVSYIKMAEEEGLYVILRPGPYICSERDFGGFPYWLLKHHDIQLRKNDENYKKYVKIWLDVLMKKLSPLFYGNGGPIIMVQVENEYGSYGNDTVHLLWLRDLFKTHVQENAVLFTTDGGDVEYLKNGKIEGVYATVDFGPGANVSLCFNAQRKYEPKGPLVNSEFYPGWLTHWGEKMALTKTNAIVKTLREMLDLGANVNFYMFHGGTNFGFTAGANAFKNIYEADITSYDYNAPITEAGDLTEKFWVIKKIVEEYLPSSNINVTNSSKGNYGEVTLNRVATFLSSRIRSMGVETYSEQPKRFEDIDLNQGYVLYETKVPELENTFESDEEKLFIDKMNDLAHVYVEGKFVGKMSRQFKKKTVILSQIKENDTLGVLVENLGRINFGPYLKDPKGILSSVTLRGKVLKHWKMTKFDFKNLQTIVECASQIDVKMLEQQCDNGKGFVFYYTSYTLPENRTNNYALDTFLDVRNLTKGLVFVNGFNLGRYWSTRGPQYTLYVPGVYLKPFPEENEIIIMDESIRENSINVKFIDKPIFDYPE